MEGYLASKGHYLDQNVNHWQLRKAKKSSHLGVKTGFQEYPNSEEFLCIQNAEYGGIDLTDQFTWVIHIKKLSKDSD